MFKSLWPERPGARIPTAWRGGAELHSRRAVMVGGRGARLADESAVVEPELFICIDAQGTAQADLLVRQASVVERSWIAEEQVRVTIDRQFDPQRERVVALRREWFEDLVLSEAPVATPRDEETAALLAREAASRLERSAWISDDARTLLARLEFLRQYMGELDLPALDDAWLDGLLPELCQDCVSFEELRAAPMEPTLRNRLTPRQAAAVEREAPLSLVAPNGRKLRLIYESGKPPTLAARIQDFFGLRETPRLAAGRAPVLLHLLAPSNRVEQVTSDLASFWKNTYPKVRAELKRRYPKHSWPEEPVQE